MHSESSLRLRGRGLVSALAHPEARLDFAAMAAAAAASAAKAAAPGREAAMDADAAVGNAALKVLHFQTEKLRIKIEMLRQLERDALMHKMLTGDANRKLLEKRASAALAFRAKPVAKDNDDNISTPAHGLFTD